MAKTIPKMNKCTHQKTRKKLWKYFKNIATGFEPQFTAGVQTVFSVELW